MFSLAWIRFFKEEPSAIGIISIEKGIYPSKISSQKHLQKRYVPINDFTTFLMKNLSSNDNYLPAFEQVVSELF